MKDKVKQPCIACNGYGYVYQNYQSTSKDKIDKILKLYQQGKGIREIARKLEIRNPYTVTYYIRKSNEIKSPKLEIKK